MGVRLGGSSNSTGFMIYDTSGIQVKSKGYQEPKNENVNIARLFFIFLIFIIGFLFFWPFLRYILVSFIDIVLKIIIFVLAVLSISAAMAFGLPELLNLLRMIIHRKAVSRLKGKKPEAWRALAEYHACEHKLIRLVEEGKEINLANLRAVSAISPSCGAGKDQELVLAEPSQEKLLETIEVGMEYLRIKNQSP